LKIVAVEGVALCRVPFYKVLGYRLTDWASPITIWVFPGQSILLSRRADKSLRILIHSGVVVDLIRVVLLGFYITAANSDGFEFVGADAPVQNFLDACLGIEIPAPLFLRDWKWPLFVPNGKDGAIGFFGSVVTSVFSWASAANEAALLLSRATSANETMSLPSGPNIPIRAGTS
jgi:hypothetical protein